MRKKGRKYKNTVTRRLAVFLNSVFTIALLRSFLDIFPPIAKCLLQTHEVFFSAIVTPIEKACATAEPFDSIFFNDGNEFFFFFFWVGLGFDSGL
jgi:hypothetical protein